MSFITNNIKDTSHFLTKYGYEYSEHSGPFGETGFTNTYMHSNDSECLWITVNFDKNKVYVYNELAVGGSLCQFELDIPSDIVDKEEEFINWLDLCTHDIYNN